MQRKTEYEECKVDATQDLYSLSWEGEAPVAFGWCISQLGPGNKIPQIGLLTQQTFIVSQFEKLEVWDQGLLVPSKVCEGETVQDLSPSILMRDL